MNVWLITIGEPLPTDQGVERLMRAGILAKRLIQSKHNVTWWSSTFNHATRIQRADKDVLHEIDSKYRIYQLHARPYRKNISFSRIWNHLGLAKKFRMLAREQPPPDILLTSVPPLELALESVRYGKENGSAVVLDVRDLWPDIITEVFPFYLRLPVRLATSPMYRMARMAFEKADSIVGITPEFVDWGLRYAGRSKTQLDRDFPMGYVSRTPCDSNVRQAREFWDKLGVFQDDHKFIVCMFGTFGKHVLMDHLIEAASYLETSNIKLVICGSGERLNEYKKQAAGNSAILFPGWVKWPEIFTLMQRSNVGLIPYSDRYDFAGSIPNKAIEYFSAGLPIVSSITGVLQRLLDKQKCGFTYPAGNPKALTELLLELSSSPETLEHFSVNARSLFQKRFRAEEVYGQMVHHLAAVVKAHRIKTRKSSQ